MPRVFADFPAGPPAVGLFALRLVTGSAFILHGWPKIQHPMDWMPENAHIPAAFQALGAMSEFGGGIALILGLLTPLATFGIAATMTAAIGLVHFPQAHPFVALKSGEPSFELALVYWAIALLFLLAGPGKISVDYFLFGGHHKPSAESTPRREPS